MDKAKLIENIKSQLKSLMNSEVKFAQIKAGDLIISSPDEELVVGSEVFQTGEDGNNIPLTDGDYTLDSGETITVVNGKIEAIVSSKSEDVEAADEDKKSEAPVEEEETDKEEVVEEKGDKKVDEEKMKQLEDRVAKCEKMLEEMAKKNNKMEQELSKFSELPSTKAISVQPSEFKSVEEKKNGVGSIDIMSIRERARKNR